jgi:hypothetical protein
MAYKMDNDHLLRVNDLIDNAVITRPQFVESSQVSPQCLGMDIVRVLCKLSNATHDAPRNRRVHLGQIARSLLQDPDLVHSSPQPKFPHHVFERPASLFTHDLLPLAQQSFEHPTSDFQALVRVTQDFEKFALHGLVYDDFKHFLELILGHLHNRILSHTDPFQASGTHAWHPFIVSTHAPSYPDYTIGYSFLQ